MSLLWFIILSIAWDKGIEIDNISFMMIAIFLCWRLHFNAEQEGERWED